ncbi:MAG: histidine phosphatase family protein [Ruminococcus sp.]|jgi:broad specificity phosphatase PhoE|nr:histidine phosphatase family protein [Ruminococcus sp.]
MLKLYIIRHPQATGNLVRRFQGHTDTDLTDEGLRQADILAEYFKSIPLDIVYSSDLKRAAYTAKKIANGREVIIDPALREINAGVWENLEVARIGADYPEESKLWDYEPERFAIKNGETMQAVYNRVTAALSDITKTADGKTVAIVSHGCAIRNMLCFIKYGDIARLRDIDWSTNAAISYAECDGSWNLVYMNDTAHLE